MLELKGKKVLVVGLGKSGLAAALFLRRRGAHVTVSDVRSAEALAKEIPALIEEGIMVETGGHGLLTFRRQDLIVVSPGVPLDTPELAQVKHFGLPDHLDRHGSFENYIRAKERIFAAQTAEDCLVLNADNTPCEEAASRAAARVYWFSIEHPVRQGAWLEQGYVVYRSASDAATEYVMPSRGIPLKGAHNVENVLAAVVAARLAGVPVDVIRRAIENFRAVEHRLEYVATRNGVEYYNDSKATNVDATAKAVASFSRGIHLILGGKDKGSPYTVLADLLRERVTAVYTIGAAAPKIEKDLRGVVSIHSCETLDKAVAAAASAARAGEVVVLAPACSSYDQFENYEQRGRVFKELVKALRD